MENKCASLEENLVLKQEVLGEKYLLKIDNFDLYTSNVLPVKDGNVMHVSFPLRLKLKCIMRLAE